MSDFAVKQCGTPQTAGKQECHFIKGTDGWIAGPAAAMEAEVLWKENNQLYSVFCRPLFLRSWYIAIAELEKKYEIQYYLFFCHQTLSNDAIPHIDMLSSSIHRTPFVPPPTFLWFVFITHVISSLRLFTSVSSSNISFRCLINKPLATFNRDEVISISNFHHYPPPVTKP